jgi:aminoglycoside/choline kinase family phosphotransferase
MDADGVDLAPALQRLYGALPRARLVKLRGDASSRIYYRVELEADTATKSGPRSLVAMRLPEHAGQSDERDGGERPAELPFVDVQRMLHARGVPVPAIYVDDTKGRVLLLEDLGDETFEQRLLTLPPAAWPDQYAQAVDLLASMHRACAEGAPEESIAFRRRFDRELLRWELDHFREWGLEALHGPLAPPDRAALDQAFDRVADELAALPQGFVHRDYQSRNLMWAAGDRLTVIDFQDALVGPMPYDLVALLCDSYVAMPEALQLAMIERYTQALGMDAPARERFTAGFWRLAVQRKLKDAGRFVFIDRVRGNPDFLRWYPQSLVYVGRALRKLGDATLYERLVRIVPGFPDGCSVPVAISRG